MQNTPQATCTQKYIHLIEIKAHNQLEFLSQVITAERFFKIGPRLLKACGSFL